MRIRTYFTQSELITIQISLLTHYFMYIDTLANNIMALAVPLGLSRSVKTFCSSKPGKRDSYNAYLKQTPLKPSWTKFTVFELTINRFKLSEFSVNIFIYLFFVLL